MLSAKLRIGVLGVQGDILEHMDATKQALAEVGLEGSVIVVKQKSQLEDCRGLIIPGGESTTIGRLSKDSEFINDITKKANEGMSILGTCAGMVLLAKEVYDARLGESRQPPLLGLMDIRVRRNAFGRQKESFEAELTMPMLGKNPFPGVFIRAPAVEKFWGDVETLAIYNGRIVAVQQGNIIATAFHPELAKDRRLHQYFINTILQSSFV